MRSLRPGTRHWLAVLPSLIGCGADSRDVTVASVVPGGSCAAYLTLQCACCGSGRGYCEQYVTDIVNSGEAVTSSTESECAARRARVTDVPAWCAATFTTSESLRAACQGFPPGSGPAGTDAAIGDGK